MAKPEWGTKRICQGCDNPFYDLNKKNIECPSCGATFDLTPLTKTRRPTPSTPKPKEEKPIVPTELEGDNKDEFLDSDTPNLDGNVEDDDDDDDSLIEDTSDLGSTDDELPKIKEPSKYGTED